jgi:hypothetical protein
LIITPLVKKFSNGIKIANLKLFSNKATESEVSETQKHLICVSTVERLINDLETLVYV